MNPLIFTATCKRDIERFAVLDKTRRLFLPDHKHVAVAHPKDRPDVVGEGLVWEALDWTLVCDGSKVLERAVDAPAYLLQQITKLYSHWIVDDKAEWLFHVDSDMWFDDRAVRNIAGHQGLWLYDKRPQMLSIWPAQFQWAETNSWLLATDIEPCSFMLEQRGWWLNREVLNALHNHVHKKHFKHLEQLLLENQGRPFSEYQLYASYARHFAREAHEWISVAETTPASRSEQIAGHDKLLFVPHATSATEPPPEILQRWRELGA